MQLKTNFTANHAKKLETAQCFNSTLKTSIIFVYKRFLSYIILLLTYFYFEKFPFTTSDYYIIILDYYHQEDERIYELPQDFLNGVKLSPLGRKSKGNS